MKHIKNLFLNEKFILAVILLNAVVIFLQASNVGSTWIQVVDVACTLIFIVEMVIKHSVLGLKGYWASGWNRLDGILVIISLPSLVALFVDLGMFDISFLLVLRLLRTLRFLRVLHFLPNFSKIVAGFKMAIRESYAILLCFLVLVVIFGLINCSLFKDVAPAYFAPRSTPSIPYSASAPWKAGTTSPTPLPPPPLPPSAR